MDAKQFTWNKILFFIIFIVYDMIWYDMIAERDRLDFDVAIVGGGPAGLATAIRLKQLCQENDTNLEVALIEKGAEIGM